MGNAIAVYLYNPHVDDVCKHKRPDYSKLVHVLQNGIITQI